MRKFFLVVVTFIFVQSQARFKRETFFHGEQVFTCPHRANVTLDSLDVWAQRANGEIDIRVTPSQVEFINSLFSGRCTVAISDLEAMVAAEETEINSATVSQFNSSSLDWFTAYHTYQEIVDWYGALQRSYSQLVRIGSIGRSGEGRDQPFVTVDGRPASNKPTIYFQCQIHAREWITSAVCAFVVNHLVTNYGVDSTVTGLLDAVRLVVVPFVNPDGYSFTWTNNRLWRKNRSTNAGSNCLGTDLNRNFDDRWGGAGSSPDPCSETFRGRAAASEVEVRNINAFFLSLIQQGPVHAAVDWHSYSQLLLRPFTWTVNNAPDESKMRAVGDRMRDIIRGVDNRAYISGKWFTDLYVSTGVAQDWFYNQRQATTRAAGYTFELRPRTAGEGGFVLPPAQIIPNGREMVAAVLHFLAEYTVGLPPPAASTAQNPKIQSFPFKKW
jgi:hypothetical protein